MRLVKAKAVCRICGRPGHVATPCQDNATPILFDLQSVTTMQDSDEETVDLNQEVFYLKMVGLEQDISLLPHEMVDPGQSRFLGRAALEDGQGGKLASYGKKLAQVECCLWPRNCDR